MLVTHTLVLDAYKSGAQHSVPLSSSDFYSHRFIISLRAGGEPLSLSDTDEATVVCESEEICEAATVHSDTDKKLPNTVEYFLSSLPKKSGSYNYSVKVFSKESPQMVYCSPCFELVVRIAGDDAGMINSEPYSAVLAAKVEAEAFAEEARGSAELAKTAEQSVLDVQRGLRNIFTAKQSAVEEQIGDEVRYHFNMADIEGVKGEVRTDVNDLVIDVDGRVYSISSIDLENGRVYLEKTALALKGAKGDSGRGIKSESVLQSEQSGGKNVLTLTFSDDTQREIFFYNGAKGDKGDKGDPFKMKKIYSSVEEMTEDIANTDIEEGDMVGICTGNVEDEDNAKIYARTAEGFKFLVDLSGAQGIKGEDGYTPTKGVDYFTEAEKCEIVRNVLTAIPVAEEVSI